MPNEKDWTMRRRSVEKYVLKKERDYD